jgi:hypothetical protein
MRASERRGSYALDSCRIVAMQHPAGSGQDETFDKRHLSASAGLS